MNEAKIGFELRKIQVPVGDIVPVRQMKDPGKTVRLRRDGRRVKRLSDDPPALALPPIY
jgi:hypothetical protein